MKQNALYPVAVLFHLLKNKLTFCFVNDGLSINLFIFFSYLGTTYIVQVHWISNIFYIYLKGFKHFYLVRK